MADIGGRAGGHWQSDKLRLVKSARGKCGRHGISVSRLQQQKRYEIKKGPPFTTDDRAF